MSILYFNNCWFTNIGEAFIDIGAMELLKQLFPGQQIINFSHMNFMYLYFNQNQREDLNKCYDMSKGLEADYAVLAGMFATEGFSNKDWISYQIFKNLSERGIKLIFVGIGGETYSEKETDAFKRTLEELKPVLVTTRDNQAYEEYKSLCPCISSIDCAFWLCDAYNPFLKERRKKYNIVTYNRSPEPKCFEGKKEENGVEIVRPFHFPFSLVKKQIEIKDNFFVSDSPYDYLTLYANANKVYTDMVHAAIPSLVYDTPVKFKGVDRRALVFDTVKSKYQVEGFWRCNIDNLKIEKQRIIDKMKNLLNEGKL